MPATTLSVTLFALTLSQAAPVQMSPEMSFTSPQHVMSGLLDNRSKLAAQLDLMHYQQQQQLYQAIQQQSRQALHGIALHVTTVSQFAGKTESTLAQSVLLRTQGE